MYRLIPCIFIFAGLIPANPFSAAHDSQILRPTAPAPIEEPAQLDPIQQKLADLSVQFPEINLEKRFKGNGSARFLLSYHGKPLKVTAFDNGEFQIKLTREFSGDDIEQLADTYPELLKYAAAFPRTVGDHTRVDLRIATEITLDFANEREFETGEVELCEIYRAFKDAPIGEIPYSVVQTAALNSTISR